MATDVEICSAALLQLGDAPIASLSENTARARVAKNLYPSAKLAVLRAHPWNCAIKRVSLAALVGTPAGGEWSNWFATPGDLLRVLDVGQCGDDDYAFEGNRILYNGSSLVLRYVADITEGNFDALLTDVLKKRMAWDMAYAITKSTSLMESKQAEYVRALREAKSIDGQENPPEEYGDSPFLQVRGGPGSGY
jgi:hypothetical protein